MKRILCRYKPLFLMAALVGAGALPAIGQETSAAPGTNGLTLEAAIRLALENNPDLRASDARVAAADGRAQQAGKWSNPELELSAEDWPADKGSGFSDAKKLIGINQSLPYPGKKKLDRRIGVAGVKFSGAELAVRRTEIVRDIKAAFYRVLAAEHVVEVSDKLVDVAESAASTARKRVEAGDTAYQEQLRAEVQWEQARTGQAGRQRELAAARQLFAALAGRPELKSARLAGDLDDKPDMTLLDVRESDWLPRHPSATAAQANIERAELEARRARLEKYPDVKLGVAGGRIGATDESIMQVGLSIPLPVLDHGKGREREASANVAVAGAELTSVQQQLQREWESARDRYRIATEQVARYRERILPKADKALHLVQTGFEQGKFGFIDLVDTQRTDAEAHLAFQEQLLELQLARAELEALLQPQTDSTSNLK